MVILSDELVNELLRAGWEDGLKKRVRVSLIESEWYTLGCWAARDAQEECWYEDSN